MSQEKWEEKCHRCGKCCQHKKYVSGNSGPVEYTGEACEFLTKTDGCSVYAARKEHFPGCIKLTRKNVRNFDWLPETCGYK